jgi:hypothetical protein
MEIRRDHAAFYRHSSRELGSFASFPQLPDLRFVIPVGNNNIAIHVGRVLHKLLQMRDCGSRGDALNEMVLCLADDLSAVHSALRLCHVCARFLAKFLNCQRSRLLERFAKLTSIARLSWLLISSVTSCQAVRLVNGRVMIVAETFIVDANSS